MSDGNSPASTSTKPRYELTGADLLGLGGKVHGPSGHYVPRMSGDFSQVYLTPEYLAMLAQDWSVLGLRPPMIERALKELEKRLYQWEPHTGGSPCHLCGAVPTCPWMAIEKVDGAYVVRMPITITHNLAKHVATVSAGNAEEIAKRRMDATLATATAVIDSML